MRMLIDSEFAEEAPRLSLNITRRHLAYTLGAISGFAWLLPVFGPPGGGFNDTDTSSIIRYLRIIMPLCVFLLVRHQTYLSFQEQFTLKVARGVIPRYIIRLTGLILALGLIPLAAGLLTANSLFIISAVLPLTISLISLLGIILLDDISLKAWVVGVTGSAFLFLISGMVTTHFESTTYFGRPRILLGFVHPIYTASAILAAMGFVLLTGNTWVRHLPANLRQLILALYGSSVLVLMLFAQSRNVLISLCLGLLCSWIASHASSKARLSIFLLLLFLPIGIYLFVLTGSPLNPIWAAVNDLSSDRLAVLQSILTSSVDLSDPQQIFEPSSARLIALSDYVGFASTDSVFQTFFFNYGLVALISFIALLLTLGWKLSFQTENIYPFGAICGMVLFFSLDAQGITTSNLILFIVFAYAVRSAVAFRGAL